MGYTMRAISFGIDVGKRHDPTAIVVAIAEDRKASDGRWETHYVVPFLKRLELDTPYPTQAEQLIRMGKKALRQFFLVERVGNIKHPRIFIDVTGVGDAMIDLLARNGIREVGRPVACRFVGGDRFTDRGNEVSVGKAYFANRLQILAESRRIHLPKIPEAHQLAEEMLDFDIDVDELSGKETYGAIRPGTHDDLVCALGLACLKSLPHAR